MAAKKSPAVKVDAKADPIPQAMRADFVIERMHEGYAMNQACKVSDITRQSFLRVVEARPELADRYARAREALMDIKAEELEEIGERAANAETAVEVAGLRLLADNRKWLLSKLAPKRYGDKVETTVVGPDGGPVALSLKVSFVVPDGS